MQTAKILERLLNLNRFSLITRISDRSSESVQLAPLKLVAGRLKCLTETGVLAIYLN